MFYESLLFYFLFIIFFPPGGTHVSQSFDLSGTFGERADIGIPVLFLSDIEGYVYFTQQKNDGVNKENMIYK
jgi:hypothetical protein